MARIVFIAEENTINQQGWQKGDVVDILADGATGGKSVKLPRFGVVDIPGITISQVENYKKDWNFELDYEWTWYEVQKGYRVRVWATEGNPSGIGNVTKANIQHWLDRWNCIFRSAQSNEVTFDIGVFLAASSEGFWERNVTGITFNEISYADNVMRLSADYSATGIGGTPLERYVEYHADGVISHVDKVIVFDLSRSKIISRFKSEAQDKLYSRIKAKRRRFYFRPALVDIVIAAGGVYEMTKNDAIANINDRATE